MSFLDMQMRLDNPLEESDIVIVEINKNDFDTVFEGKARPLNPPKLQKLITSVSLGKPCVIGVDIGTDYPEFGKQEIFAIQADWPPIVWVRDIKEIPSDVEEKPVPAEILGGQTDEVLNSGVPLLIDDAQGVTRKYKRMIETEKGDLPSFVWAIYRASAGQKCAGIEFPAESEIQQRQKETSARLINYSRGNPNQNTDTADNADREWKETDYAGRVRIPASQIIELAESPDWQDSELIKDKIVLIGGSYGEDVHETPLGKMPGVEIIANVIETEIAGGGIEPPGFLTMGLLALFDGLLLIGLFHIFSWQRAFLLSTAALFGLSFICSFLTFYSFSYWILFAPVMFGILMVESVDRVKDYLKDYYKSNLESAYKYVKAPKSKKENIPPEDKS
jgi:CHASE2 domain-containing sensor protein